FPYVERSLAGELRPKQGAAGPSEAAVKLRDAYTKAAKYADFREMLDKQRDIDAVVIATPDHTHAVIAMAAMQRRKHIYVQKPLTYSVYEARLLAKTAASTGVVAEMGNQGHSLEGTRRIAEIIASGVLGPVSEVYVWTDRPVRYWAQGIPRPIAPGSAPAPTPPPASSPALNYDGTPAPPPPPPVWNMRTVDQAILKAMADGPHTPPPGFNWDLFLGPAKEIPYHPAYHPFAWRGWVDFGVGAIGDMGAHLIDQPFWALGLTHPTSVSATSTPWGGGERTPATYPLATMVQYEFAARPATGGTPARPPVKMYWYDGGLMPPRPPFLPDDIALPRADGGGGVFVGTRGILVYETYGNNPKVYPASVAEEAERVAKTVPRIEVPHEVNFAQACKGEAKPSAPFDYSAALTETMLLGLVALRAGQGKKVFYDGAAMQFTNAPEVNQYLTREYRAGWAL
ncbi:MAG: oxidoreductase domain protein, partial [Geminicoccaceae bacterium]|nr:oxidoreductase domain protein [Geminicoccaceae bacterium]